MWGVEFYLFYLSFPIHFLSLPSSLADPPKEMLKKKVKKKRKKWKNISSWKLYCDIVSYEINHSVHITLLANLQCKVSLVWF